ncbi:MAG: ParA family protein [Thermodesulfovibrionales bacterium]|jgi:chromosome partitioning protein
MESGEGCRVITIANARGGVGKTFLSIHLAYMLADKGKKVLLVDTDPQGTVGLWLNLDSPATLFHLLLGESSLDECILRYKDKFDIILAKESIKEAEIRMVGMVAREHLLKNRLEEFDVFNRYDYVLIDTSPSLSLLNQNAYLASKEVLVPVNMEPLAVVGASSIIESIKIIRKLLKHKITLLGIVPTFVSKQSNVAKQVLQMIHTNYDSVLPQIRSSVRVKEASGSFMTINEYDAKNGIIEDLQSLVDRVMDGQKV